MGEGKGEKNDKEREEMDDGLTLDFSEENDDSFEMEESQLDYKEHLPAPIHLSLTNNNFEQHETRDERKMMTKDHIVELYCSGDIDQ